MVLEGVTIPDGTARWTTFSLGIYKTADHIDKQKGFPLVV